VRSETELYVPSFPSTLLQYFKPKIQREVQENELAVIRDFESRILSLQDEDSTKRIIASTAQSESLARLTTALKEKTSSHGL